MSQIDCDHARVSGLRIAQLCGNGDLSLPNSTGQYLEKPDVEPLIMVCWGDVLCKPLIQSNKELSDKILAFLIFNAGWSRAALAHGVYGVQTSLGTDQATTGNEIAEKLTANQASTVCKSKPDAMMVLSWHSSVFGIAWIGDVAGIHSVQVHRTKDPLSWTGPGTGLSLPWEATVLLDLTVSSRDLVVVFTAWRRGKLAVV